MIHAFRSPVTLPAPVGDTPPPARLVVAKWGRNEALPYDQVVIVNETTAACLPANQRVANFDRVALDFNHNTLPGTEAYKADKEPRFIAATGVPRVVPGEGLVYEDLQWTPKGIEAFTGKHFPDLSPAVKMNAKGEVIFIHSAGLCHQGSITGLHAFSVGGLPTMKTDPTANPSDTTSTMDFKKLLCLMLGLDPAKATDAEIEAAATKWAADHAGDKPAPSGEAIAAFTASLKAVTDRLDARERSELVAKAIAAGKIIPLGVEGLPVDKFKEMIDSLPADQVPMDKRTPEGIKAFVAPGFRPGAPTNEDAAAETAVNAQLGIKPAAAAT